MNKIRFHQDPFVWLRIDYDGNVTAKSYSGEVFEYSMVHLEENKETFLIDLCSSENISIDYYIQKVDTGKNVEITRAQFVNLVSDKRRCEVATESAEEKVEKVEKVEKEIESKETARYWYVKCEHGSVRRGDLRGNWRNKVQNKGCYGKPLKLEEIVKNPFFGVLENAYYYVDKVEKKTFPISKEDFMDLNFFKDIYGTMSRAEELRYRRFGKSLGEDALGKGDGDKNVMLDRLIETFRSMRSAVDELGSEGNKDFKTELLKMVERYNKLKAVAAGEESPEEETIQVKEPPKKSASDVALASLEKNIDDFNEEIIKLRETALHEKAGEDSKEYTDLANTLILSTSILGGFYCLSTVIKDSLK